MQAVREATEVKHMDVNLPTPDTRLLSLWNQTATSLTNMERREKDERRNNNNIFICNNGVQRWWGLGKKKAVNADSRSHSIWLELCEAVSEKTSLNKMWKICNSMLGKAKDHNAVPNVALQMNVTTEKITEMTGPIFFPQATQEPKHCIYRPEKVDETPPYNLDFTPWEL